MQRTIKKVTKASSQLGWPALYFHDLSSSAFLVTFSAPHIFFTFSNSILLLETVLIANKDVTIFQVILLGLIKIFPYNKL